MRITLVAALVTIVAVSAGGWLLINSVEGGERNEIRQDNEDLLAQLADELRTGVHPACLLLAHDSRDLGTAQVRAVDVDGSVYTFTTGYLGRSEVIQSREPEPAAAQPACEAAAGEATGGESASGDGDETPATDAAYEYAQCMRDNGVESYPDPVVSEGGDHIDLETSDYLESGDEEYLAADAACRPILEESQPVDEAEAEPSPIDLLWDEADPNLEGISQTVATADGDVGLTVVTPLDQVTEAVNAVRTALLVGLPLLLALVVAAAWLLVGRALRPVEAIRSEAEAIGGSTLDRRVPAPDSRDEIGRLAQTMNAMLGRLETSARRQRQFVADASHELRSPLSAIRTDLEVVLLEGDRGNWRESVRASLHEEARLEALITDLLILAADDEDAPAAPSSPVDVAALARDEAARPRRLPVVCTASPSRGRGSEHTTSGSTRQLQRVVANLVDNAVRYARSEVRVTVESDDGQVQLTVDDDGPGIPVDDRDRVFERFTRLDDGRAREDGGSGLGLAVVRSIVVQHRGDVHVDDSPLGGARLVATLPAHCP